jgi:hypothetical protein
LQYCVKAAGNFAQDRELKTIINYIETIVRLNGKVTHIEVDIDWNHQFAAHQHHDSDESSIDSDSTNESHGLDEKADLLDSNEEFIVPNIIEANDVSLMNMNVRAKSARGDEVNYWYEYYVDDDNHPHYFDNSANHAKVNYFGTFNLAVMFDFQSLWRRIFAVFCTLKFEMQPGNTTPLSIIRAQLWARDALYKASIFGTWLLYDYAWFAGGTGVYMLAAFVHYSPFHFGFAHATQQMCEHWGKEMKTHRSKCGNAQGNRFLYEIGRHSDLYVMARLLYDLIDFSQVAKEEKLTHLSIWDDDIDPEIEKHVLHDCPSIFQDFRRILGNMHVNDKIPESLKGIDKQCTSAWAKKLRQTQKALQKIKINVYFDEFKAQNKSKKKQKKREKKSNEIYSNINRSHVMDDDSDVNIQTSAVLRNNSNDNNDDMYVELNNNLNLSDSNPF